MRRSSGRRSSRRRSSRKRGQAGFTLVEIMIALIILAVLTVLSTQAMQRALRTQSKIRAQTDLVSRVRASLRIIERDVNLAFHHRDLTYEMLVTLEEDKKKSKKTTPKTTTPGTPAPPPPAPGTTADAESKLPEPPPQLTNFIGDGTSLHLTTTNHLRTMRDAQESDQNEVGYFLRACRGRINKDKSSSCLWRRTTPYIDDDVTDGGGESVLLENIEKFELQYFGPNSDDWVVSWRSDDKGTDETKDVFPYAVRVLLSANDGKVKPRKVSMTMVATIRFPNNKPPATENPEGTDPAPTGGSGK